MEIVQDSRTFRLWIDENITNYPGLFPPQIQQGYLMKDDRTPKKQPIPIRRIEIDGVSYSIRPSFVMPYMTGFTEDVEPALFMRKFSVPYWALARNYGRDPMYWYRLECSLGRNSIVGTTIQKEQDLPKDLVVDEKHSKHLGEKNYIATTVGAHCVLGVSITKNSDESSLFKAYEIFKEEARTLAPAYTPTTVNTDGWAATQNAWKKLFPKATLILCILHIFISIRDRLRRKARSLLKVVAEYFWNCYHSPDKFHFAQRIRRFCEWAEGNESLPGVVFDKIQKLRKKRSLFATAYDFPEAHRTSTMLDRAMQRMDRHLFSTQYFHGKNSSAELSIRGWALIYNFAPFNPYTQKLSGWQSYAEQLNQFRYHDNWLQNLLISASLGGFRRPPQNPV